jgi:3-phenylpropionate/trans-cinnamate dioxygenase ferredoxin subunit
MGETAALEWVDAGATPPGEGAMTRVDVRGRGILVCRASDRLYAIEDRCPHAGVSLAGGRLAGFVLECPLHGGRLDVRDGSPVDAPIRRAAERFAVREGLGGELELLLPQSA